MQCPVCKTVNLMMTERQGIEIDYCPQCRGVWLDRGELDKIIDRSAAPAQATRTEAPPPHPERHHKKKREGFLAGLFDFD
ncbi:MAG: zf-TFIIB domain-containing protein [Pseudomonadota bacterium]